MEPRLLIRIFLLSAAWAVLAVPTLAQQQAPRSEDVVRVSTELVQTDFMVFDKQGNFVDGLKKDQFVLKVEGKPRGFTFFDRITAGSRNEEAQLAAARGNSVSGGRPPVPLDRGRVVMFFIDDLHLSTSSANYTRAMLKRFIDREMRQNDEASITSVSGQLGFLQQLTSNKAVLTAAADRLRAQQSMMMQTAEYPPMSVYQAQQIELHDTDLLDFFIDALLKENPMLPRQTASEMVRARASQLLEDASSIATRTLGALKGFIDITAGLPGRKVVFFISDGFFLDRNHSDNYDRLQRITSAAARAGVVVYSIDARGLTSGLPDASQRMPADTSGVFQRSAMGEVRASQDAMNALASDTGGRSFFNSNNLSAAVATGLKETSIYYLLAWRPENEEQRNQKFRRIEVSVVGRPELIVRFRRGVGEANSDEAAKKAKDQPTPPARKPSNEEMNATLRAHYPLSSLPVSIALNFLDTAQYGGTLTTSIKVSTGSLTLESQAGTPTAVLDVAGLVLNDQGKSVSTFNKRLTIKGTATSTSTKPPETIFYNHFALIKPGLYQVRVAAIDVKLGTAGSAHQWIEIPNLQSSGLTLSSLIVGERKPEYEIESVDPSSTEPQKPAAIRQVSMNVDRRFARSSYLRFLTFIYNAVKSSAAATPPRDAASGNTIPASTSNSSVLDLAVQVQVFRDNEPVITTPLHKIQTDGATDLQRVPYAADVMLNDLSPGFYVLQVTIIDRLGKASASQRLHFQVD